MVEPSEVKNRYKSQQVEVSSFEHSIDTHLKYSPISDSVSVMFFFSDIDTERLRTLSKYIDMGYTVTVEPQCRENKGLGVLMSIFYKF